MKTLRYATPGLSLDITMPIWIFWAFKRFANFKVVPVEELQGQHIDIIVFDEAGDSHV